MTHPATLPVDQLLDACELRRQRRSGPGGQHRNKVETAVVIRHLPTGCEAAASERRSQAQNRSVAIERLRLKLACEFRSPAASEPSALWQQRSAGGRLRVSATHSDFPAILAECLDRLQADDFDIKQSAEQLHVSSSQLVKLLRQHAPAFTLVNDQRQQRGLRLLK